MDLFKCSLSFLVTLDDGLGCRVVDTEFLGHLSDKIDVYIDDAPSFLNASKQLCSDFFPDLFVFFTSMSVLDVVRLHFVEN